MKVILIPFILGLLISQGQLSQAFFWTSMEPVTYCTRSDAISINSACKPWVYILVNRLTSPKSSLASTYHDIDFCLSDESYPQNYPIFIEFLKEDKCSLICKKKYVGGDKDSDQRLAKLKQSLRLDYKHNWSVDDIPVKFCSRADFGETCTEDFDVGGYITVSDSGLNDTYYFVNNHLNFEIVYQSGADEDWGVGFGKSIARIVDVKVTFEDSCQDDKIIHEAPLQDGEQLSITYTYSVRFVQNDTIKWSDQWNSVRKSANQAVDWFSIFVSVKIVIIYTVCTYVLLKRITTKERNVNPPWSLLQGDIFRSPSNRKLLSALIGCGIHALATIICTIIYGYVVYKSEDSIFVFAVLFYFLFGLPAGYISGLFYKRFRGEKWIKSAFCNSAMRGVYLILLFVLDISYKMDKRLDASSFISIWFLFTLGLFVALLFTFYGTALGFHKNPNEPKDAVNVIHREIPMTTILRSRIPGIVFGGLILFLFIYIQLSTIQYAYLSADYPILFLLFLLQIIMWAESMILICYNQLRVQDYNWWWRSFLTSGCAALYMLIYCCVNPPIYIDSASIILYCLRTIMWTLLLFVMMGTVGFLACYWLIRKLFDSTDKKTGYYNENLSVALAAKPVEKIKENILV